MHHDGAGSLALGVQSHLLEVDVLQEAQDHSGVVGDSVVRPRLEMKLVDVTTTPIGILEGTGTVMRWHIDVGGGGNGVRHRCSGYVEVVV